MIFFDLCIKQMSLDAIDDVLVYALGEELMADLTVTNYARWANFAVEYRPVDEAS
jgi:hypothetical protein